MSSINSSDQQNLGETRTTTSIKLHPGERPRINQTRDKAKEGHALTDHSATPLSQLKNQQRCLRSTTLNKSIHQQTEIYYVTCDLNLS